MSSERIVKDIRRATRKQYSAEEKIRIVLDGCRANNDPSRSSSTNGAAKPSWRRAGMKVVVFQ
jgi:transposase